MATVHAIAATALAALAIPVLFLVPGYLLQTAYLRGARKDVSDQVMLARSIASALLIHALALTWTLWLFETALSDRAVRPFATTAWALVVLLAAPIAAGAALERVTRARRPRWLARTLDFAGFAHHMRMADAWTYLFAKREAAWVRVRLVDGRVIVGRYGPRSFAASDSVRGDLYLEQQYQVTPGKVFGPPIPASAGVWIRGDQIVSIELFSPVRAEQGSNTAG